ncbi:unnamed protein product [Paramecium primaurelia]|uniref:Uncharacterized protein n=1 Tax=Paramecium primaurelia TaxID=5886 RepID=A0A8S1P687_PARPR|nr:unnamed protein product [Paramecium primaurelia]
MIPKVILLTQKLFENVDQQQQQSQILPCNYQHDIDLIVDQIKYELGNVDPKIIRNYSQKIIELQSISNEIQDIKVQLDIYFQIPSNLKKKQAPLIYQENKQNIKQIKLLIQKQLNDLSELSDVTDVENYMENEYEKIYIFRLSQIYQNEIDNLQYQFLQSQINNNVNFNKLNEKFLGIINDQTFIKISCQIHKYIVLLNLIDEYRDKLFEIIKSKSFSTESIIYQKSKQKARSLQYESISSLDLIDDENKINKRQHPLFKQEDIKNKRFENYPEACVKCQIF